MKTVFQTQKGICTDETYRDCGLVHKFQPGEVPALRKGNGHGLSLLAKQLPTVNTCGQREISFIQWSHTGYIKDISGQTLCSRVDGQQVKCIIHRLPSLFHLFGPLFCLSGRLLHGLHFLWDFFFKSLSMFLVLYACVFFNIQREHKVRWAWRQGGIGLKYIVYNF